LAKKKNTLDSYQYTAKGAKDYWNFVQSRSNIECSDGGVKALMERVKNKAEIPNGKKGHSLIVKKVNEVLSQKGYKGSFTRDHLQTIDDNEEKRIVFRTGDILASYVSDEFISYTDWNEKRLDTKAPGTLGESPWHLHIVRPFETDAQEVTYCIQKYWLKISSRLENATLVTESAIYKSKPVDEISKGYFHLRFTNSNKSDKTVYELYLNYPKGDVKYIEGMMLTASNESQLGYNRVLLEAAPGTPEPKTQENSRLIYHTDAYNEPEFQYVRDYFSRISKHVQSTAAYGLKNQQDVLKAGKLNNEPKRAFRYDLYISSIATSGSRGQVEICQAIGMAIIDLLTTENVFKKDRIYAPAIMKEDGSRLKVDDAIDGQTAESRYVEGRKNFLISRYHMLLLPFDVRSVAYDQAVWCFNRTQEHMKRCVAIVGNENQLSKSFKAENYGTNGAVITLSNPEDLDAVRKELKRKLKAIKITYAR